jgi:hypothetical protein
MNKREVDAAIAARTEEGKTLHTDANGYTSKYHLANPALFHLDCKKCGKHASTQLGMRKERGIYYLCLKCYDEWSIWCDHLRSPVNLSITKQWNEQFRLFLKNGDSK